MIKLIVRIVYRPIQDPKTPPVALVAQIHLATGFDLDRHSKELLNIAGVETGRFERYSAILEVGEVFCPRTVRDNIVNYFKQCHISLRDDDIKVVQEEYRYGRNQIIHPPTPDK